MKMTLLYRLPNINRRANEDGNEDANEDVEDDIEDDEDGEYDEDHLLDRHQLLNIKRGAGLLQSVDLELYLQIILIK